MRACKSTSYTAKNRKNPAKQNYVNTLWQHMDSQRHKKITVQMTYHGNSAEGRGCEMHWSNVKQPEAPVDTPRTRRPTLTCQQLRPPNVPVGTKDFSTRLAGRHLHNNGYGHVPQGNGGQQKLTKGQIHS